MTIAIACDHGGYPAKEAVVTAIRAAGHDVLDLGTDSADPVDYPDYAAAAAEAVRSGRADRAIVLCGSGVGAAMVANKIPGVRAGVCHDVYSAHQGVEHDDLNVLALGARVVGPALLADLVATFLRARFSGEERHRRRLAKVTALEEQWHGRRED
jgi:ribose 5-phosphate isomerase B